MHRTPANAGAYAETWQLVEHGGAGIERIDPAMFALAVVHYGMYRCSGREWEQDRNVQQTGMGWHFQIKDG